MPTPHALAQRHWWLRMMLTGASEGGDAASAIYGTILAASVLVAVGDTAVDTFLAVIVTWLLYSQIVDAAPALTATRQPGPDARA